MIGPGGHDRAAGAAARRVVRRARSSLARLATAACRCRPRAQRAAAASLTAQDKERAERLIVSGDRHLEQGNIGAARMFFQRAAEAGLAERRPEDGGDLRSCRTRPPSSQGAGRDPRPRRGAQVVRARPSARGAGSGGSAGPHRRQLNAGTSFRSLRRGRLPEPVAPGRKRMPLAPDIGHRIEAVHCPRGGIGKPGQASASFRATPRCDRSPRAHTPSRSAGAGTPARSAASRSSDRHGSAPLPWPWSREWQAAWSVDSVRPHRALPSPFPRRAPASPGLLRLGGGQRAFDRIEHQQRGGMPRLVVLDRLEHGKVGPASVGRRPARLQHLAHGGADLAQLMCAAADDIVAHDRGRRLPQQTGLHGLSVVRHPIVRDLQIDGHRRTAQLGMGRRRRIRVGQPLAPRDIARKAPECAGCRSRSAASFARQALSGAGSGPAFLVRTRPSYYIAHTNPGPTQPKGRLSSYRACGRRIQHWGPCLLGTVRTVPKVELTTA